MDLQAKLPADKKGDSYSCSVTGDRKIFYQCEVRDNNGDLYYRVNNFTDRSMIGKTVTLHVTIEMENYTDVSYDLTVTLTDQKKIVLKEGSEVKVLQDQKLTYGGTLSDLQLNLEGEEQAVFVEQGTDMQVQGTLEWKDGTQRPDTSVTSAEWIFMPSDEAYANAEGSTAIKVNAKELTVTKATARNRKYDGTNQVAITEVLLSGMLEGDEVSVDLTDLHGTLKDKKAGEYTSVTLPKLTLAGKDKANYRLVQPVTEIPLTKTVTIETPETKETPETPQKPSDPGTKPGTSEPIQKPSKPEYLKKGTKFIGPDKNQYKVTCADGKTFTVAYLKPKKGVKGTVKIPDSITVNHVTYKVTEIAANAFKNQKKIRKVVIPSGVSRIGKKAFYGCKNLKNITIKTTKLTKKRVGSKAFFGIHAKAVIKVPKKKLSAYRKMLKARGVTKKEKVQAIKVKSKKA